MRGRLHLDVRAPVVAFRQPVESPGVAFRCGASLGQTESRGSAGCEANIGNPAEFSIDILVNVSASRVIILAQKARDTLNHTLAQFSQRRADAFQLFGQGMSARYNIAVRSAMIGGTRG